MQTPWIGEKRLARALQRNEDFWRGELEETPLLWVTVPNAKPGPTLPEPECEASMWTDVDYVMASTELELSRTYYAGDALPVFNPWLGPDQFAAWLGADILLKPKEFTSWVTPLIEDWDDFSELRIDPNNRWWQIYLNTLKASVEAGKEKWVTGYPDLHTGMDAMSALRGPEKLTLDLIDRPEVIYRAMRQLTDLWREVVDTVSEVVLPGGQGTSNWTMGWSEKRFLCIGQNDFTCMIGRPMFEAFCLIDNIECCNHVDYSLYHLDGPGATRHLPAILEIESLTAIQWIQGAGNPPPSKWLEMLQTIQRAGKGVQLYYGPNHGDDVDLLKEIEILCRALDISRLFVWATVGSVEQADAVLRRAQEACRGRGSTVRR